MPEPGVCVCGGSGPNEPGRKGQWRFSFLPPNRQCRQPSLHNNSGNKSDSLFPENMISSCVVYLHFCVIFFFIFKEACLDFFFFFFTL